MLTDPAAPTKKNLQLFVSTGSATVSQDKIDKLIMDSVSIYMEPLSIVEQLSFIRLINGLQPDSTVVTRKLRIVRYMPTYFVFMFRSTNKPENSVSPFVSVPLFTSLLTYSHPTTVNHSICLI